MREVSKRVIIVHNNTNNYNNIIAQAGSMWMGFKLTTTSTLPVEVGRCRLGRQWQRCRRAGLVVS